MGAPPESGDGAESAGEPQPGVAAAEMAAARQPDQATWAAKPCRDVPCQVAAWHAEVDASQPAPIRLLFKACNVKPAVV